MHAALSYISFLPGNNLTICMQRRPTSCLSSDACLQMLHTLFRTSLPGELRLAPHAPSPGWHVLLLLLSYSVCQGWASTCDTVYVAMILHVELPMQSQGLAYNNLQYIACTISTACCQSSVDVQLSLMLCFLETGRGTRWYSTQCHGTQCYSTRWYGTHWYGTQWYGTHSCCMQ